jgi:catechol 2,3-dioxygenase-like lactoylglutathione lyase family enzyme
VNPEPVAALDLGQPYHVGFAVRDLDDAIGRMSDRVGVGEWGTFEAEIPSTYRGHDQPMGARVAYARVGAWYLELVQPTSGPGTAKTFLEERGEGIYHLGYWVDDLPAAVRRAEALGFAIDSAMPAGRHAVAVYLDSAPTLGMHIELVSTGVRQMIEDLVAKAGAR